MGPIESLLRRRRPIRPARPHGRRHAVRTVRRRRLVGPHRPVPRRRGRRVGGKHVMKGHYNDGFGFEWAEVNGSEGVGRLSPHGAEHDPRRSAQRIAEIGSGSGRVSRRQRAARATRAKASRAPSSVMTWFGNSFRPSWKAATRFQDSTRARRPSSWPTKCWNRSRSRRGYGQRPSGLNVSVCKRALCGSGGQDFPCLPQRFEHGLNVLLV